MSLKDRIIAAGLTVDEVAKAAKTPSAHLYNILNLKRRPRPELAEKIERACKGVITAEELIFPHRKVS
jgi:transcriptional regulator with XRE-family HTH domain